MTLVEVMAAVTIFAMMMGGILAVLLQTRRLSAASIAQNCAVTIVQGYVEQLKTLPLQQFVNAQVTTTTTNADINVAPNLGSSFSLPLVEDPSKSISTSSGDSDFGLKTTPSTVDPATMLAATAGTTPTGVYDNLLSYDTDSRAGSGSSTWSAVWPGANTTTNPYPSTNPGRSDLRINIWVQITDQTPTVTPKMKAYGILVVYTWQYVDGNRIRYAKDSVRTIRSAVQTF